MKKALPIITLSFSLILLLAGCETTPSQTQLSDQEGSTGQQTSIPTTGTGQPSDATTAEGNEPVVEEEFTGDQFDIEEISTQNIEEIIKAIEEESKISAENLSFYEGALKLNDASYCDMIVDAELAEQCKKDITDLAIMDKAISDGDKTACEQLEGTKVDFCKMQIDLRAKEQDNFRDSTEEELRIMDLAVEQKDVTICDQIESEVKRENCITNVETYDETMELYDMP